MNSELWEEPAHSSTHRLNHSSRLGSYPLTWICIFWDIGFVFTCWIVCWTEFFKARGQKYPYASFSSRTVHKTYLLFCQVLWVFLTSLMQNPRWSWQRKNFMAVYIAFSFSRILLVFHLFRKFCQKSPPGLRFFLACCQSHAHIFLYCYAPWKGEKGGAKMGWFLPNVSLGKG